MGVDRSDGCYICPTCRQHVKFSRAELHPCPIEKRSTAETRSTLNTEVSSSRAGDDA